MTDTNIARLAILAGWRNTEILRMDLPALSQFAALVAEECAKVADEMRMGTPAWAGSGSPVLYRGDVAKSIRAKFKA